MWWRISSQSLEIRVYSGPHSLGVALQTLIYQSFVFHLQVNCPLPLLAQLVKNLAAMWETWVRSLGWEDPLEKGKATHSTILAWIIPWTLWDHKEPGTTKQLSDSHSLSPLKSLNHYPQHPLLSLAEDRFQSF